MTEFYSHSENDSGAGVRNVLRVHLKGVAAAAAKAAGAFGSSDEAHTAGLLHDLGKYATQFQDRLNDPSRVPGRDHWTAGAIAAVGLDRSGQTFRGRSIRIALAILGHHIGLPPIPPSDQGFREFAGDLARTIQQPERATDPNVNRLFERCQQDGLSLVDLKLGKKLDPHAAVAMLDVRMLFSALVDADFVETEAHFNGDANNPRRSRPPGPTLDAEKAWRRLCGFVTEKKQQACSSDAIQSVRTTLWEQSQSAATGPTGSFTLTAPTGAGKTLAMLGFALRHAKEHPHLRRIVVVLPYLNIIEQTAREYERLFGSDPTFPDHFVLEDHSLADSTQQDDNDAPLEDAVDEALRLRRLLAENWDAPIVLTTHVKCLESLMAHRPAKCRKLHRLAGGIILFDEVQTLPPKLAVPTLATLSRLADPNGPYRSTVVFATATQPAFDHLDNCVRQFNPSGWQPQPMVEPSAMKPMFQVASDRIRVTWRHQKPISIEQLAIEFAEHDSSQLLCIVNLKRHAADLTRHLQRLLGEDGTASVVHLSTSLCPAHRRAVLETVIDRLSENRPCRLIATQCVEAGVDLDFPVVYRSFAPLDAIAQAAGRCNRHGSRPNRGQLVVIDVSDGAGRIQFPPGYGEAVGVTRVHVKQLEHEHGSLDDLDVINSPDLLRRYFRLLYELTDRGSGTRDDERDLVDAILGANFEEVAKHYRLIDGDTINVLVRYNRAEFDALVEEMSGDQPRNPEMIRQWILRARPHAVGIYRPNASSGAWSHLQPVQFSRRRPVDNADANWFHTLPGAEYCTLLGLKLPEENSWVV